MILLIDNYDSFSYNLYQLIGTIDSNIKIILNDELTLEEIEQLSPSHIFISSGSGESSDTGVCIELINKMYKKVPILGVGLGHQIICEAFGAKTTHVDKLMHGKISKINIKQDKLFLGLPNKINVALYHSFTVVEDTLPPEIKVTATSELGEIMSVRHLDFPLYGVQFHPESFLTLDGKTIIKNFLGGNLWLKNLLLKKQL